MNLTSPSARAKTLVFVLIGFALLVSSASGGLALLLGLIFALALGNPCIEQTRKWTPRLLQISVIGLGAAVNLLTVGAVGLQGVYYTATGIGLTMLIGWILGRWLKIDRTTATLLSAGTAICGGSAIAAVAPTIQAKDRETSVSLATVFFLNAIALFIFPTIGHWAGMTEAQFGLWSALAIHDTSSVVGASMQYGPKALEIGTTVKLTRALWIVPMTLAIGFLWHRGQKESGPVKAKKPWFILGFVLMSAVNTWVPAFQTAGGIIALVAKRSLVLTLFLIGSGLSREALMKVGIRPLLFGVLLWILAGSATFFCIHMGWIS